MKITRTNLFLWAGAFASLSSIALAQNATQRAAQKAKVKPVVSSPVVPKVDVPAPAPAPTAVIIPTATPNPPAVPAVAQTDLAARGAFQAGLASNTAGDLRGAEAAFRQAIVLAPAGEVGDSVSMEAAKRLGFLAFENRDPRTAETFFGAEAVLARRLYFSAKISPRGFADAVGRFAVQQGQWADLGIVRLWCFMLRK